MSTKKIDWSPVVFAFAKVYLKRTHYLVFFVGVYSPFPNRPTPGFLNSPGYNESFN